MLENTLLLIVAVLGATIGVMSPRRTSMAHDCRKFSTIQTKVDRGNTLAMQSKQAESQ